MSVREAKKRLRAMCGEKDAKFLLWAIKKKMPIMIYDRHLSGCDPYLYRILKSLGAPIVRNYDMQKERFGKVSGIYCTVFIDTHSSIASNFTSAGESSEILKQ